MKETSWNLPVFNKCWFCSRLQFFVSLHPAFTADFVLFLRVILQLDSYFCFQLCFSLFPFFPPFLLFPLSDKAPGQRECDTSIDNINKCIRDIEQASLAAVSQNLPSRDDISLEVNDRQTMTRHFPRTATCMQLFAFLGPNLVVYVHHTLLSQPLFYSHLFFLLKSLCELLVGWLTVGVFN